VPPSYGYDAWAIGWDVNLGEGTNDYDGDLLDNLGEYGLNGNPTNNHDVGVEPRMERLGVELAYIHLQRNDDTNLVYSLETRTNLVSGIWTNLGYTVIGTNLMGGGLFYDEITNIIPTTASQSFIRFKVEDLKTPI